MAELHLGAIAESVVEKLLETKNSVYFFEAIFILRYILFKSSTKYTFLYVFTFKNLISVIEISWVYPSECGT